jgi:hypothetical protein
MCWAEIRIGIRSQENFHDRGFIEPGGGGEQSYASVTCVIRRDPFSQKGPSRLPPFHLQLLGGLGSHRSGQ